MVAFIPARTQSKRIPNKNVRDFYSQPIINYTIQAALESKLFDKIVISTDNVDLLFANVNWIDDIIQIIERSEELSGDGVILYDTLIDYLNKSNYQDKLVCLLYPCAPFITSERLIEGYQQIQKGYDVVYPITKSNLKVQQLLQKVNRKKYKFTKSDNKKYLAKKVLFKNVFMLHPEFNNTNSNDWYETYIHASQWFWCDVKKLYTNKTLVPQANAGYVELPWYEAQDIDTLDDWKIAEWKYQYFKSMNNNNNE